MTALTNAKKSLFDELPLNGALADSRGQLSSFSVPSSHAGTRSPITTKARNVETLKSFHRNHGQSTQTSLFDELPNQGALVSSDEPSPAQNFERLPIKTFHTGNVAQHSFSYPQNFPLLQPMPYVSVEVPLPTLPLPPSPQLADPKQVLRERQGQERNRFLSLKRIFPPRFKRPQRKPTTPAQPLQISVSSKRGHFQSDIFNQNQQPRTKQEIFYNYQQPSTIKPQTQTVIVYGNPPNETTRINEPKDLSEKSENGVTKNEIHYHYHMNDQDAPEKQDKFLPRQDYYHQDNPPKKRTQEMPKGDEERREKRPPSLFDFRWLRPRPLQNQSKWRLPGNKVINKNSHDTVNDRKLIEKNHSDQNEWETPKTRNINMDEHSPEHSREGRGKSRKIIKSLDKDPPTLPSKSEAKQRSRPATFSKESSEEESISRIWRRKRNRKKRPKRKHEKLKTSADSHSYSYELPPPHKSHSYHPPPKYGWSPQYGPPSPPPPPPPSNDQPVDQDTYHTTISLQTVPVTRQITEFVQVPNIIHELSSSQSDQPVQNEEPQDTYQPYGPSHGKKQKGGRVPVKNTRKRNQDGFQSHISKLFGGTPGLTSNSQTFGLLGQNRNRFSNLELLELLGAQTNPVLTSNGGSLLTSGSGITSGLGLPSGLRQFPITPGLNGQQDNLRELVREQRYQNILTDLSSRLREESRAADRARSDYFGLFSKGALLLSALTLLPNVVNPFATSTLTSAVQSLANQHQLPIIPPIPAMGRRRKRSIPGKPNLHAFQKCLVNSTLSVNAVSEMEWVNCSIFLEDADQCYNNLCWVGQFYSRSTMSFIRAQLAKYLRVEISRNFRCLQNELCKTIEHVAYKFKGETSLRLLDDYLR